METPLKLALRLAVIGTMGTGSTIADAQSDTSIKEAAREFVAQYDQSGPHVIRYEIGASTVSDNYPSAIEAGIVPKAVMLYPVRIHWYLWSYKSFFRSDFFLFQDAFGSWKDFYTRESPQSKSTGPAWIMAARERESDDEACITDDQRISFENWKREQAPKQEAAANYGANSDFFHSLKPRDPRDFSAGTPASRSTPGSASPASTSDGRELSSRIESAEKDLNLLYGRIRARLNQAQREGLKREEIAWIQMKDSLQATQKLDAIQQRIQVLRQQYGE